MQEKKYDIELKSVSGIVVSIVMAFEYKEATKQCGEN